ncbi:uncharacterized protein BDR25DRAFT_361532 [Lindgomyces ingoldianus]|uniref:Uncharacterized protein n=1 Tax=Lindgomyces ingoldianus TaxID=673940 RepID=A0ACB6QCY4_9PLEO|nr:uncharacterized protein BDR25DRAFT_361532 [Lindgomyces ingoldianus]KAF2464468.1 hypothetical protein BDR25DRAFT_361532 [Lindgomyces ingoldianus]
MALFQVEIKSSEASESLYLSSVFCTSISCLIGQSLVFIQGPFINIAKSCPSSKLELSSAISRDLRLLGALQHSNKILNITATTTETTMMECPSVGVPFYDTTIRDQSPRVAYRDHSALISRIREILIRDGGTFFALVAMFGAGLRRNAPEYSLERPPERSSEKLGRLLARGDEDVYTGKRTTCVIKSQELTPASAPPLLRPNIRTTALCLRKTAKCSAISAVLSFASRSTPLPTSTWTTTTCPYDATIGQLFSFALTPALPSTNSGTTTCTLLKPLGTSLCTQYCLRLSARFAAKAVSPLIFFHLETAPWSTSTCTTASRAFPRLVQAALSTLH